jgi:CBS domain-containing protein
MSAEDVVGKIMRKNVVTVQGHQTVRDALKLMVKNNIGCVVVVEGEKPVGIFTERDIICKMLEEKDLLDMHVSKIAVRPLVTVKPSTNIVTAFELMNKNKFRRLPVVEEGRLVGIVTQTDLSFWVIKVASEGGRTAGAE